MLEKSSKKMLFDAHFHYSELKNYDFPENWKGCTCAHSIEEWNNQENASGSIKNNLTLAFGLHPQSASFIDITKNIDFLEDLLRENKIQAIGETGFDFYTEEFCEYKEKQEKMFNLQLELAILYKKPVVIHCRKANDKLFEYSKTLKQLPAVLFHSFMGSVVEANSLLNKGINGYFSFGKQMMNNNKKVIQCCSQLKLENLLLETDAPFQTLKGEAFTKINDIENIYDAFYKLRKEDSEAIDRQFSQNYNNLFYQKQ